MMSQPDTSIRDTWSALLFCLALLISALPGPALALQARGLLQLPKLPIRKTQRTGAFYFEKTVNLPSSWDLFRRRNAARFFFKSALSCKPRQSPSFSSSAG